ncbi:hypothetical protein NHQ30_003123 [Ciborinia camelliae]|nr:hypothetical protein NHQ30_003123 [Ciborinia camelliae]
MTHWQDTPAPFWRRYLPGQTFIMQLQVIGISGYGSVMKSTVCKVSVGRLRNREREIDLKTGDAFRFKPDGVIFNTPSAYQTIYQGRANVKKGKFYEIWPRNPREINTLNTTDKRIHGRKRKILNQAFTVDAIRTAEAFITRHVDR